MTWFLFPVLLFIISAYTLWKGIQRCQNQCFYKDTPGLWFLGIFVWGDALILGPFWMLSSVLFFFFPPLFALRYFLIFFAVRSAYEVVYWINHQVAQRDYRPPLFRRFKWLSANDAAVLYQLLNMCVCIFAGVGLMLTFTWVL